MGAALISSTRSGEEDRRQASSHEAEVGSDRDNGFDPSTAGHVRRLGHRDRQNDGAEGGVARWNRVRYPDDSILPQSRWEESERDTARGARTREAHPAGPSRQREGRGEEAIVTSPRPGDGNFGKMPVMSRGDQGTVIVADDLEANIRLLRTILEEDGYVVYAAANGRLALDLIGTVSPDIVLSDVMMPEMTGFELCRHVKADAKTRLIPVVLITSLGDRAARIEGITAGADDFLTKPYDLHELRARVSALVRLKRFTDDLDSADALILSLSRMVEARDAITHGHCERMAALGVQFGRALSLSERDLASLHRGGFLHDVGKIGVPDSILLKPGALTDQERATMQNHTVLGDTLLSNVRLFEAVRPIVRHHHERYDGSGYPDGLAGNVIPLLAQVIAIVDVYDALTSPRVYRAPLPKHEALGELARESERGWRDPALIVEFVRMCRSEAASLDAGSGAR